MKRNSDFFKDYEMRQLNDEFRGAAVALIMLTEPKTGLLMDNRLLMYAEWRKFKEALTAAFNTTFSSPIGKDLFCWELLVKRGLASIDKHLAKDPRFARTGECHDWLRDIAWMAVGDTGTSSMLKPRKFEKGTRHKLVKLFTKTFVQWCVVGRKFDNSFFRAIARGRFGEDKELWQLLKVKILKQISLLKRRRKS